MDGYSVLLSAIENGSRRDCATAASTQTLAARRPVRLPGVQSFCESKGIAVLPLSRIQRGVFVTHQDRQQLMHIERNEEDHRRDIEEAAMGEYGGNFKFFAQELARMHQNVLATRRELVLQEARGRIALILEEEDARIPISHERCRSEFSYKYLEQILKRGAIIEDDMFRERKMTAYQEETQRKWLLSQQRSVRDGIARKEASNIRYMNIQAACFAKAAAEFHQVVYDMKHERAVSRASSRHGGRSLAFSPNTTMDSRCGPAPDDVEAGRASPPRPLTAFTDESQGQLVYIPQTEDVIQSIISPLSPLAGTKKHSLKRTQHIQEVLASRPALYTKKDYSTLSPTRTDTTGRDARSPSPTGSHATPSRQSHPKSPGGAALWTLPASSHHRPSRAVTPMPSSSVAKKDQLATPQAMMLDSDSFSQSRLSLSTSQQQRSKKGRHSTMIRNSSVDTHSLAPIIPYWLFQRSMVSELQALVLERFEQHRGNLDLSSQQSSPGSLPLMDYPNAPFSAEVKAVAEAPTEDERLQLLLNSFHDLDVESQQLGRDGGSSRGAGLSSGSPGRPGSPSGSERASLLLRRIEIGLTAASILCKREDARRSIQLVAEAISHIETYLHNFAAYCGSPYIFKFTAVAFHNAAMALAMLPIETSAGGSSINSNGRSRGAASRLGSRARESQFNVDVPSVNRVGPLEFIDAAYSISTVCFGNEDKCAFTRHLRFHGLSNVLQLHVLPKTVLPPKPQTRGALVVTENRASSPSASKKS